MKNVIKNWLKGVAAVVALSAPLTLTAVAAEDYPDRPITLMVSYGAGGATDFQARLVTMMAAEEDKDGKPLYLNGQPVVIVNRPGAGGQVGWNDFVVKSKPDGYSLAVYNFPHFMAQSIVFKDKVKYSIENLEPIANWGADPAVLIVGKDSEFNSVDDLIKYAKANPGKVTVSGSGLYVGHHIADLQLDKAAGVQTKYVPAGDGVKALQFVMGGQTMAGFNNLSDAYRNQDRLKILAIADLERNEFLPDVPTLKELGLDVDNSSVNFRGIMAPKGTPDDVVNYLSEKMIAMFNDKNVIAKMKEGGSPMKVMSQKEVAEMWKGRQEYLATLLKDLQKE